MRFKNFARNDNKNDAMVLFEKNPSFFMPFYNNADIQGPVWVLAQNKPRNPYGEFGPLKQTFYISGYVEFQDNSPTYTVFNSKKWDVDVPFYIMRSKDGRDVIKLSIQNKFNASRVFKTVLGNSPKGQRMVSKIGIDYMLYDPETGAELKNYDKSPYEGWEINLGDFESKSTRFMFNIMYRPQFKWYRTDNNKQLNHLLTVRHSWGVFENMALFKNELFEDETNLHLLGHTFNGFNQKITPVITKYLSFTHTYGPLKYSQLRYNAQVTKPPKEKVKGWETLDTAT